MNGLGDKLLDAKSSDSDYDCAWDIRENPHSSFFFLKYHPHLSMVSGLWGGEMVKFLFYQSNLP
jgi:hypothetical protein